MAGAKAHIQEPIDDLISEGLATEDYRAAVSANLHYITNDEIPGIGKDLDIVFESIFEDPEVKRNFYAMLNKCCRVDCIFASNTSGMDIFSACGGVISELQRLVIAHWFNPPHLMKLVEVARGPKTSDETVQAVARLLESVDRKPAAARMPKRAFPRPDPRPDGENGAVLRCPDSLRLRLHIRNDGDQPSVADTSRRLCHDGH